MTTSRKHLIAALALALPAAALLVSPAFAASTLVHPGKHHVTHVHHRVAHAHHHVVHVHHVVHRHQVARVHRVSAHHRAVHPVKKPHV